MSLVSLRPYLNMHTLQHPPFNTLVMNIRPFKRTMRSLKFKFFDRLPNQEDLVWWQGYAIGD